LLIEPRPDLVLVVVNNRGGGIFSFLPQVNFEDHFEAVFATPTRIDLPDLARMHGLSHSLIASASRLTDTVAEAAAAGGVHLVEVRTDRAANVELHRRLTAAVQVAIAPSFE
jgi:2-succinyl-5-enolpyruvyl-6-hydroxy-3-cyclohexene-1-carboxylate synthase